MGQRWDGKKLHRDKEEALDAFRRSGSEGVVFLVEICFQNDPQKSQRPPTWLITMRNNPWVVRFFGRKKKSEFPDRRKVAGARKILKQLNPPASLVLPLVLDEFNSSDPVDQRISLNLMFCIADGKEDLVPILEKSINSTDFKTRDPGIRGQTVRLLCRMDAGQNKTVEKSPKRLSLKKLYWKFLENSDYSYFEHEIRARLTEMGVKPCEFLPSLEKRLKPPYAQFNFQHTMDVILDIQPDHPGVISILSRKISSTNTFDPMDLRLLLKATPYVTNASPYLHAALSANFISLQPGTRILSHIWTGALACLEKMEVDMHTVLPILQEKLQSPMSPVDSFNRFQVAESILRIQPGDQETISFLIESLESDNDKWSGYAIEALGNAESHAAHAAPLIRPYLNHKIARMREITRKALENIGAEADN
jgi:hypothetical protein